MLAGQGDDPAAQLGLGDQVVPGVQQAPHLVRVAQDALGADVHLVALLAAPAQHGQPGTGAVTLTPGETPDLPASWPKGVCMHLLGTAVGAARVQRPDRSDQVQPLP